MVVDNDSGEYGLVVVVVVVVVIAVMMMAEDRE